MTTTSYVPSRATGLWFAASYQLGRDVTTREPYPCLCSPKRGSRCSGWKGCPCYQRIPEPHLPVECCGPRTHQAMLDTMAAAIAAEAGAADTSRGVSVTSPPVLGSQRPDPAPPVSPSRYEIPSRGIPVVVRAPHQRRWPPEMLTCPCPTPWDDEPRTVGYHCLGCCRNFVNYSTAEIHKRRLADPCKDPAEIKDCDTGRALFQLRVVNGFPVWGWAPMH